MFLFTVIIFFLTSLIIALGHRLTSLTIALGEYAPIA